MSILCSLILRHLGYRVHEAHNEEDLAEKTNSEIVSVLVAERSLMSRESVQRICSAKGIICIPVSPEAKLEDVLLLLEERAARPA